MHKFGQVFNILGIALITVSSVVATAQSRSSGNDDVPNHSLLWEYKMMCTDKKAGKEYECESDKSYNARLDAAKKWTSYIYSVISRNTDLADKKSSEIDDVDSYCPNFDNMSRRQKVVFWGQFIAAITYKESSWNPTTRSAEPLADFPKPDPVTGKRVYSEGLMQLSYQDARNYDDHFKCDFDWSKDRKLDPKSPHKTILSAEKNLKCGLLILNHKVNANQKISSSGAYWSVIRPRAKNKYSQTLWISKQTKKLPFCNK